MKKQENILKLIKSTNDFIKLKHLLSSYHPYDIASILTKLEDYDKLKVFAVFTDEELGEILTYIDTEDAADLIENLNDSKIASIINTMEPDDATDIVNELDDEKKDTIINLLDEDQKEDITTLTTYPEDTAGAMMNSNFISIITGSDIKQIMKEIVVNAPDVETINTSFVVDQEGHLLGTLDLKKIIVTKSPATVDSIMNTNFISVNVDDSFDHTISLIKDYDIFELPVLENGILKGIITMDDAISAYIEETEDDYIKFAGVSEVEKTEESVFASIKKRIPWLVLLLFLDILISLVISRYDYLFQIDALTILVVFQPIILGLAGNCGTQSLAVTIRQISNNDLNTNQKIVVHIAKESILGIMTGLFLGVLGIIISFTILKINHYTALSLFDVAITVATALLVSACSANIFGAIIPIFFYKIKIDPAAASGPLITTIIDIIAVVIYFTLATIILYSQIN